MKPFPALLFLLTSISFFYSKAQECYPTIYKGEGTYYEGIAGSSSGNCSLPVAQDDYFHCAMNTIDYNNSEACGACINVTGPNGSVILKVVDRCPECKSGDIDMTEEAFSQIANVIDGRVAISWQYVTCTAEENNQIQLVFKEGSSEFWTGIQLRNTTHAVESLHYQLNDGSWKNISRELYNYFIAPEGITSPMNLKATSVVNEELIFENINLNATETEINTQKQFSTPEDCQENLSNDEIITTNNHHKINLFPSPSFNNIFIETSIENYLTAIECVFFNTGGQKINMIPEVINNTLLKINTQLLDSGVYILVLNKKGSAVYSEKLVIK